MNRKVGGQRIEKIRSQYPGYYQKRGCWKERKMQLDKKQKDPCLDGFWGWKREGDESAWDLHKSGYDFQKLSELVQQHKFKNINKVMPDGPKDKHLAVKFYK